MERLEQARLGKFVAEAELEAAHDELKLAVKEARQTMSPDEIAEAVGLSRRMVYYLLKP